jgi:hypothetical protein
MQASHKALTVREGLQEVAISPGQFIFGRKRAAKELGMSEQNVRTCLSTLKNARNLVVQPTNKFSIITITNWDAYQGEEGAANQQNNQQVTSNQPTTNQQVTTYKNIKKVKNEKKKRERVFVPPSIEEVSSYAEEIGYELNVDAFMSSYEQKGWKVGKGAPMKSWQAAVRNWKANGWGRKSGGGSGRVEAPKRDGLWHWKLKLDECQARYNQIWDSKKPELKAEAAKLHTQIRALRKQIREEG